MENHDNDNADSDSPNVIDKKKNVINEVLKWQGKKYN